MACKPPFSKRSCCESFYRIFPVKTDDLDNKKLSYTLSFPNKIYKKGEEIFLFLLFTMDLKATEEKILRGTSEIIDVALLEKKLLESATKRRPLRIKAGFDPTAPDIHLGHVVLLKKLRLFQDLGHEVYFLIGDFTARVGDPSGQDHLRLKMSPEKIKENAKTYKKQVFKILSKEKTKIVFNSKWLGNLSAPDILELTSFSTVAQMLARADFKKRFEEKKEISLLEFVYPLLQGYDSVYLKADLELGGMDQKFNLLMGRQLQEAFHQDPQVILMMPLLEGLDGFKKMSKSLNNYVGINEPPQEIFGKIMSIADDLMYRYYEILTVHDLSQIKALHPKEAKLRLAEEIVAEFYNLKEAAKARAEFEKVFSQHEIPGDILEFKIKSDEPEQLASILIKTKLAASKNEVRRLLKQGAITHEGHRVNEENWQPQKGILKIGKRRFLKLS
jgi:tyrosyl-tRNA synthetase